MKGQISICLVLSLFCCRVHSGEIAITSLSDSGPETLREALLNAQNGDILNFQTDLSGTIVLQSSLPEILTDLTINGPVSRSVAIDGGLQYQIFKVSGSGIPSIFNLDLVNGATSLGGAVLLQSVASASLTNVFVTHCNGIGCDSPIFIDTGATLYTQNLFISGDGTGKGISCSSGSTFFFVSDDSVEPRIVIEGSTSFLKTGRGTAHLFSSAPIDADLTIDQGSLVFNGATNQPIHVNINGKLKGTCSCLYLFNDGVVAPGNSIGTMTVVNDYDQKGVLEIELSAFSHSSDLLQVGGNTSLSGTLILDPEPGLYLKGETFTILTTGGSIDGSFTNSFSTKPGLNYVLHYFPTSIQVEILKNTISLEGATFSGNTNKIASTLATTTITPGSDLFAVASALTTLDGNSLQSALNQLNSDLFLSTAWSDATTLYQISGLISSQQFSFCNLPCSAQHSCCPPYMDRRIWVNGIGERTQQHTIESLIGFRTYTEGLFVGYDQTIRDPITVGGYGGYTHSNLVWKDSDHKGKSATNGYYVSAYGLFCLKHVELDASLLGSFYQREIARKIDFATIHRTAQSSPHGFGLLGHLGATGTFSANTIDLFPFAKLDYISIWQSHFREHGAKSIDLVVDSTRTGFIHAEVGLLATKRYCISWGAIAPRIGLSWVYLGPTSGTDIKGRFEEFAHVMSFRTSKHKFNSISPMVALDMTVGARWWISFAYKGEFSHHRAEQNLNLNARWQF